MTDNKCKCGSTDFHSFFSYEGKKEKRFRCKQCNTYYRNLDGKITEMEDMFVNQNQIEEMQKLAQMI